MTDFIHEPKNKPEKETTPAYVPPKSEKERAKRVYLYSVILFTAALVLMLWSFLANNRSYEQLRDALKTNTDVLQGSIEENAAQEKQIAVLEAHIADLESRLTESQEKQTEALAALRALDYLRSIESAYALGDEDTARELVRELEKEKLAPFLPSEPLHSAEDASEPSPAAAYEALIAELFPDGIN